MSHPTDQIETYLTGGLSPGERTAFEVHLATCGECADALADARAADVAMNDLFAADRPSADFEDRMIQALTLPQPWLSRPIVHPMVRRAAVGIAASLMIAGIGYTVNRGMDTGGLPGWTFLEKGRGNSLLSANRDGRVATSQYSHNAQIENIAAAQITYSSAGSRRGYMAGHSTLANAITPSGAAALPAGEEHQWLASRYTGIVEQDKIKNDGSANSSSVDWSDADKIGSGSQRAGQGIIIDKELSEHDSKLQVSKSREGADANERGVVAGERRSETNGPGDEKGERADHGRTANGPLALTWAGDKDDDYRSRSLVAGDDVAKADISPDKIAGQAGGGGGGGNEKYALAPMGRKSDSGGSHAEELRTSAIDGVALDDVRDRDAMPADIATEDRSLAAKETAQRSASDINHVKSLAETQKKAVWDYYASAQGSPADSGGELSKEITKAEGRPDGGFAYYGGKPASSGPVPAGASPTPPAAITALPVTIGSLAGSGGVNSSGSGTLTFSSGVTKTGSATLTLNGGQVDSKGLKADVKLGDAPLAGPANLSGTSQSKDELGAARNQTADGKLSVVASTDAPATDLQRELEEAGKETPGKTAAIKNSDATIHDGDKMKSAPAKPDVTAPLTVAQAVVKPPPATPGTPPANTTPPVQNPQPAPVRAEVPGIAKPKIIRTGEMEFEVDSFESAVSTITKVVEEEGGYVSTTNSDKLPNGKVKGEVVLRVTPDRLDTLVLKLRGIGDLKTQNIRAQDITKQYTDLESRLRAAQIMCDQILDIIKSGKAAVKDLLEAEKQLGVYREKVEQLTGEINYYANQVSLSTLTLTLFERDIRTPASASEIETVTMTMVTEKVDEAAIKAKDAIAAAKGRIIASQQSQTDEGQSTATIKAQVPPDAAEEVIAKLKQIQGQLDHFDRQRSQTTSNGSSPVDSRTVDPVKIKREDVTIDLTLYNLAKLTPRRSTDLSLAATDVDEAKHALEDQVRSAGGRIIDSRTEYPRPDQKKGTIAFDVPTEKADALIAALKGLGETLQISTVENANAAGVTESKRGFNAVIYDMASVQPRRQTTLTLIATAVDQTQNTLADQVKAAGGRVIGRTLEHPAPEQSVGSMAFEIPTDKAEAFLLAMKSGGEMLAVNTSENAAAQNVTESKRGFQLTILSVAGVLPRHMTTLTLAATGVDSTQGTLAEQIRKAGGRVVNQRIEHPAPDQSVGFLDFELPPDKADAFLLTVKQAGETIQTNTADNSGAQIVTDAKLGFHLKILDMASVPARRVTTLTLVPSNVDETETTLAEQVRLAGGRMTVRKVEHPAPDQSTGAVAFEVPGEKAEAFLLSIRKMGETMQVATADNTSGQVVTDSKRGFGITLRSLTTFKAREAEQVTLASANVRDAFNDLRGLVHAQAGRVLTEHLNEEDSSNSIGQLEFEISRESAAAIDAQMARDGQVVTRLADRRSDTDNTIDSKVYVRLTISSAEQLPPRQISTLGVEVADVQRATDDLGAAILSAGGRQVETPAVTQNDNGLTTATLQYDLPLNQIQALVDKADTMGLRKSRQTSIDTHAPEGKLARAHLTVTFSMPATLSNPDDGLWAGVRRGLVTSLRVLSYSLTLIIIGLCVVVPFGLVLWASWRGVKWARKTPQAAGAMPGT